MAQTTVSWSQRIRLEPRWKDRVALRRAANQGGLHVQFNGRMGEVNVTAGLENRQEGYSAVMPFWMPSMASMGATESASVTLGHPGIMVGSPDPLMGFPVSTRFVPYLALRNITAHNSDVNVTVYTEQGVSLTAPVQTLQPWESRQVDMANVLQQLGMSGFNGILTLAVTHTGQTNDVISAALNQHYGYDKIIREDTLGMVLRTLLDTCVPW